MKGGCPETDPSSRRSAAPASSRGAARARLLVALITFATFAPLIRHDFGGFDDDITVARNPRLNPPTWSTLRHYWTRPEHDLYVPFTYTVWSAAARVAWLPQADALGRQLNPYIFHLLNVGLHTLAAIAAFELLFRCVGSPWPAMAGALVFALHPLQVESVGWVAGMKDVLAGLLALVALWQYLVAAQASSARRRRAGWLIGTVAFLLAMLSKPNAVVVPGIALVLDWLVTGRSIREALWRVSPWLLLAIPCVVWTRLAQPAVFVGEEIAVRYRPLIATDALAFYLYKLGWPVHLAVDYGRTPQVAIAGGWIWFTWVLPLGGGLLVWLARRQAPALPAAGAIFVIALAPVLGLVPFDFQAYSTVADHYMYLPMLAPALAAGCVAARPPRRATLPVVLLVAVALAVLSLRQTRHWRDAQSIFEHTLRVNPTSWAAHARLAEHWAERGHLERALTHTRSAAQANERAWPAYRMMGDYLARMGRVDEAANAYRAALAIQGDDVHSHTNLANLLADQGRYDEAIRHYQSALRRVPYSVIVHTNLAATFEEMGRLNEAAEHYRRALEIDPTAASAQAGLRRVQADLRQR